MIFCLQYLGLGLGYDVMCKDPEVSLDIFGNLELFNVRGGSYEWEELVAGDHPPHLPS